MNINDQYTNRLTDRFLTSSDYLSLQNITLGYTLPKSLTRKMQIDGVRVFFVADNVALLDSSQRVGSHVKVMWLLTMYIHLSAQFPEVYL